MCCPPEAPQRKVGAFIHRSDFGRAKAGLVQLDDRTTLGIRAKSLDHMPDRLRTGPKPPVCHGASPLSAAGDGENVCRGVEVKMFHGTNMGTDSRTYQPEH